MKGWEKWPGDPIMVRSVPERSFWPLFSSPDGLVGAGVLCGLCYSICTLPRRKSTSCTGKMGLAWWCCGVNKEQILTHLDRKDLCLGRAYASGRLSSPHLRDEDKANSYLTCHPNFNKVLVSLLYQLALFPSHSWDLTRSSQLVCITLGCPSSRESPLRWELLGQGIVVWRIW